MRHNKPSFLLAALLISVLAFSQGATENRLWSSLSYQWKPADDMKLTHSFLCRELTGLELDRFIFETELDVKGENNWTRTIEFRHYLMIDSFGSVQGIDHRGRMRLMAEKQYKQMKGTFKMRYALQHREIYTGLGSRKTDFRVRAAFEYPIKDFAWDPEFQVEYLGTLGGNYNKRLRMGISTSENIEKSAFSFGYFYERNLSNTGFHYHSLTVGYAFKAYK